MSGTTIAFITAGCISCGTVLGLVLSKVLPDTHLNADSKDAVKLGAGMITMMAALVLGLLVSSAKSTFDSTNAAVTQAGAKAILMDRLLATYGLESKEIREDLRRNIAAALQLLWPEEGATESDFKAFEHAVPMEKLLEKIRGLKPQTETQRALQVQLQQLGNDIMLSRWLQIEQAYVPLPMPFLVILLFWLTLLYTSFGLLAPRNATVITIMFLGALALATALFLIVEMSRPMAGAIKVSSAPIRNALEHIGR